MLTTIAKVWGYIFLIVGILGFTPAVSPGRHLLGVFHVNGPHNIIHILTGVAALFCGYQSVHASKLYFLIFGAIYGLVAILGFISGNSPIFGFIANNLADAWLHVSIAVVAIALGLSAETTTTRAKTPSMP